MILLVLIIFNFLKSILKIKVFEGYVGIVRRSVCVKSVTSSGFLFRIYLFVGKVV